MFRYDATVEAHTLNGYYVSYDEWGNKEEVMLLFPFVRLYKIKPNVEVALLQFRLIQIM